MRISVVGIGVSDGGLEALRLLLAHLPAKSGLAFLFVQNLDPEQNSSLTEILAGVSAIPVAHATDGVEIEPDHLYVLPPDTGLQIVDQVLKITPHASVHSDPYLPIDRFLRSLAQEFGSRTIGVLLSGAGLDGIAGLEAVKTAGGVTFVQNSMSPEAIAKELTTLARRPYCAADEAAKHHARAEEPSSGEEFQSLKEELERLRNKLRSTNAQLAAAHDLARLIVETTAAPLLLLDSGLRVITANPSFNRAFRVSPHEVVGQLLHSFANGSWNIPQLREMLERILRGHQAMQDIEIEQDFPGIGHRVLALTVRRLEGPQQILVAIEDITEPKGRAELALRESEERFRSIADTAPVLIWASGPDRACTFFNKPWLTFTGRSMQQELGDGWTEGVHPGDRDRCLEVYASSFDSRRNFQIEYRLRRSDGEYRWLMDNGVPHFEQDGAFIGYVGSCIDITDFITTQEEDFAKQKLETVGTLAGGIAHDFNNLLGGILAHSELALTELAGGSSPREELRRIRAAAIRGAEIVRQLMIYTGQESEVIELVDVAGIVEDMLELLQISVSKHVKVETSFSENRPLVRASPTQIRQIAMNLITNASEAIGDRDGVIRVTTGRVTIRHDSPRAASEGLPVGEYVQLEIIDTGRGMTREMQARVFDPFFTTKVAGSHGQGLVVVQRIVQSLHGTIRLSSAPGEGATFSILLPAENNIVKTSRGPSLPVREEPFAFLKATILIVDDEDLLRQAVSKMLRKQGLSVIEASDGSAAMDVIRAKKDHIDVLLLDVTLPGASSREVYQEAKRLRPGMQVIVTSAKTEEMAAASLATSIERFLRKPFGIGDLLGAIRELLSS